MPIVHYAEVPGYVTYQPTEQNGAHVVGGSNWDISRSAVETPITPLVLDSQDGRNGQGNQVSDANTQPTVKKAIKKRRTVKVVKHKKILVRKDCPCTLDK